MKLFILPYMVGSRAVKQIKNGTRAKVIKLIGSKWKPKPNKIVINWGTSAPPLNVGTQVINKAEAVASATNKLTAFVKMQAAGISIPEWTANKEVAKEWFDKHKKCVVFCRTKLRSSGGDGIVIATSKEELVNAPLYTLRVKKVEEYRVHIFTSNVIDVVKKKLRNGAQNNPNRSPYIRNLENGWVFAHDNVDCPNNVKEEALKAVNALGLDFGAVDIAVNKEGKAVVFEVNTAPGLENFDTIEAYVTAFNNYKKQKEEEQYAKKLFQQRNNLFNLY